jgi:hypothetical protein
MACAGSSLLLVREQIAGQTVDLNSVVVSMSLLKIKKMLEST